MANPTEKYLFEQAFVPEPPQENPQVAVEKVEEIDPFLYTEEDLLAATAQAREEGLTLGLEQARAEIAHHAAKLLELISEQLATIQQAETTTRDEARYEAVEMAYLVARKLAHTLILQMPQADIEEMIGTCLRDLAIGSQEPRVRISVAPQLVAPITEHFADSSKRQGFGGEVIVVEDANMDIADCRVEWKDGGAERSSTEISQLIDDAVQRFLQNCKAAIDPVRNPEAAIERAAESAAHDAETVASKTPLDDSPTKASDLAEADPAIIDLSPKPVAKTSMPIDEDDQGKPADTDSTTQPIGELLTPEEIDVEPGATTDPIIEPDKS